MPRTKIRFDKISQLQPWAGQIIIEEVAEESALHQPVDPDHPIVLAGRGSARNPKKNLEAPAVYLVRAVGEGVTKCKEGDWVIMSWRAVMPESEACMTTLNIREGNFALVIEDSIAGTIKSLSTLVDN